MKQSSVNLRTPKLIIAVLAVALAFIFGKLFWIDFIKGGEFTQQALDSRTVDINTTAKRGTIYDRNGVVLACSVDVTTIVCDPTEVNNASASAEMLADILGGEKADYLEPLTRENTRFAYIARQVDVDTASKVESKVTNDQDNYSGIYFQSDTKREYPNGSVAGQVIGLCDTDGNGICGLELEYDDVLKGENGVYKGEVTRDGTTIPGSVIEEKAAVAGEDIVVSIDVTMQQQMETYVEAECNRLGTKGTSVLMDAETGEIYAICSYPFLNPGNPSESETGSDNLLAITQAIEPGSVMKTVTALGVLQAGTLSPSSEIGVPASLDADEYTITDSWEHPATAMTLDTILTMSSNIGISLASDTIGAEGIFNNLDKSQILNLTGVDFPGEAEGYVTNYKYWSNIARYNITFGQGLTATPIEVTRFYAAICNDGVAVTPHFLLRKINESEDVEYETHDLGYSEKAISDLQGMLRHVVTNNNTAADVEGYEICGKTSTAEYTKDGVYVEDAFNLAFCGFVNNASTSLVCYTGTYEVPYKTQTTGLFKDIMEFAIDRYSVVNTGETE